MLTSDQHARTHIFNTFFYGQLTKNSTDVSGGLRYLLMFVSIAVSQSSIITIRLVPFGMVLASSALQFSLELLNDFCVNQCIVCVFDFQYVYIYIYMTND